MRGIIGLTRRFNSSGDRDMSRPKAAPSTYTTAKMFLKSFEDESASPVAETEKIPDHLYDTDPGCLIVNVQRPSDKLIHWIPPNNDPKTKDTVLREEARVARTHLPGFTLDHESNRSFLDGSLQVAFETYSFFAITVSLKTGQKLIEYLEADHASRQRDLDLSGQNNPRHFQPEILYDVEYQMVALHPQQLLPLEFPLMRQCGEKTWVPYIVTKDDLLRATQDPEDINADPFPLFRDTTIRKPRECLNPWFVILNAEAKFQNFSDIYGLEQLPPSVQEIAHQTFEIVNLIYRKINSPNDGHDFPGPSPSSDSSNISRPLPVHCMIERLSSLTNWVDRVVDDGRSGEETA